MPSTTTLFSKFPSWMRKNLFCCFATQVNIHFLHDEHQIAFTKTRRYFLIIYLRRFYRIKSKFEKKSSVFVIRRISSFAFFFSSDLGKIHNAAYVPLDLIIIHFHYSLIKNSPRTSTYFTPCFQFLRIVLVLPQD